MSTIFMKNNLPVYLFRTVVFRTLENRNLSIASKDHFEKKSLNIMQRTFYQYFLATNSILTRSLILGALHKLCRLKISKFFLRYIGIYFSLQCNLSIFIQLFLKTSFFTHEICEFWVSKYPDLFCFFASSPLSLYTF